VRVARLQSHPKWLWTEITLLPCAPPRYLGDRVIAALDRHRPCKIRQRQTSNISQFYDG